MSAVPTPGQDAGFDFGGLFDRVLNTASGVAESWLDYRSNKLAQEWEREQARREQDFAIARLQGATGPVPVSTGGTGLAGLDAQALLIGGLLVAGAVIVLRAA